MFGFTLSSIGNAIKALTSDDWFPPASFHFEVRIAGAAGIQGKFQEVSGLDVELEIERIKEAGNNAYEQPVPGRTKYNNLVLKRGFVPAGAGLYGWVSSTMQSGLNTKVSPRTIIVTLLSTTDSTPLMSWNFANAYPVKWSVGGFNAMDSSIVIETLEFTYQEWKLA